MSKIQAEDIRNLAIIGHSGEGKTSVCEAILFNGKSTDRLGKVPDGNTVTDYDEQEIARKMSISLSVAYTEWEGAKINLLDVPGFYDFEGEMNEALRAAGGALIVMGANGTVTVGAEKAIAICQRAQLPMVIFINGMDKDNADYAGTVAALKQNYAGKIAPIQIHHAGAENDRLYQRHQRKGIPLFRRGLAGDPHSRGYAADAQRNAGQPDGNGGGERRRASG